MLLINSHLICCSYLGDAMCIKEEIKSEAYSIQHTYRKADPSLQVVLWFYMLMLVICIGTLDLVYTAYCIIVICLLYVSEKRNQQVTALKSKLKNYISIDKE